MKKEILVIVMAFTIFSFAAKNNRYVLPHQAQENYSFSLLLNYRDRV